MAYVDAHVDYLIRLAQQANLKTRVNWAILHSMDEVFRPVHPSDNPKHQEPASCRKLAKGDGHMATKQTILGWDIDSRWMTICLTSWRLAHLKELLESMPRLRKHLPVK